MKISEQIKHYRQLYFMSQTELANLADVPQYRLSRIEAGQAAPTFEELERIADAFDLHVNELMDRPGTNLVERYLRDRNALGHLNGIPEAEVIRDLNLTERALRGKIQRERTNGALICHNYDEHGYYIAGTTREKQQFLRRHMATIRTLSRECKAFRDDLKANGESPCA